MGKLGLDASVNARRRQIAGMKERGIITIKSLTYDEMNEPYNLDDDVYKWSDVEVVQYYQDNITEKNVTDLEEQVAKEEKIMKDKKNAREERENDRPTMHTDEEFIRKDAELFKSGLSMPEIIERRKDLHDELEYRQLQYDIVHNVKLSDANKARYKELDEKYSVKVYEEQTKAVKETERKLNLVNSKLGAFKKAPKKPGTLANWWNNIQKTFSHKDTDAVKQYNIYRRLRSQQTALEFKVDNIKSDLSRIEYLHKTFDYKAHVEQKDERLLKLAKHIITMSLKGDEVAGKGHVELTEEELTNHARSVMQMAEFNTAVAALGADEHQVDPGKFHMAFMNAYDENKTQAPQNKDNNNTLVFDGKDQKLINEINKIEEGVGLGIGD